MTTQSNGSQHPYYGRFPYLDFVKTEGVPVVEALSVDCHTVPVEPWERLGGRGAYVHLAGRSDYLSSYVVEIPPGGQLNPEQHMHDELIHVVSGRAFPDAISVPAAEARDRQGTEWRSWRTAIRSAPRSGCCRKGIPLRAIAFRSRLIHPLHERGKVG